MNLDVTRLYPVWMFFRRVFGVLVLVVMGVVAAPGGEVDPAAVHSRLFVIPEVKGNGKSAVVALGSPTSTEDQKLIRETDPGILLREVVRQALLLAAREELGLRTRDEVLGDVIGKDARTGSSIDFSTVIPARKSSQVLIRKTDGADTEVLLDHVLTEAKSDLGGVSRLVEVAEALSRTEFPGLLKKLGLKGQDRVAIKERALADGTLERLSRLSFVNVLDAVRTLHGEIRSDGESAARLGGLIRGYALMGVLTEHHWHPGHKVFKARALLYSQRWVAREPKSPLALWHRAYAGALAGLHRDALSDAVRAAGLAKEGGDFKAPGWVEVIDAYLRCDLKRLRNVDGPEAGLAALLRLAIVEYPGTASLVLQAGREVLAIDPECLRAIDAMCAVGGVGNLHMVTMQGASVLEQILADGFSGIRGLPGGVREQLEQQPRGEVAVLDAFEKAGEPARDDGEPSWAVFATMLRESRFVQVYRRLQFMKVVWGVPVEEYWAESSSLVAGHPYRLFLEAFVRPPAELPATYAKLVEGLDLQELEVNENALIQAIARSSKSPKALSLWAVAVQHGDATARDQAMVTVGTIAAEQAGLARGLLVVSPYSPYARSILVEKDWDNVKNQVLEWAKESGDSPTLLAALARRMIELKRFDDAERCLSDYIKISPDYWGYHSLADLYKGRNDLKRWQETLDDFLANGEDPGLDHARVGVEIAETFMKDKLWDKAWPYAEAAAATWAGWAMNCAQRCAVGMEKWEQAELYAQRETERYPSGSWAVWFLFCKNSGHGDVMRASAFVKKYLAMIGDRSDIAQLNSIAMFQWLDDDIKAAVSTFQKFYEKSPDAGTALMLLMAADDLNDRELRDRWYKVFWENYRDKAPKSAKLWGMFHQAMEQGPEPTFDLKAIDAVMEGGPVGTKGNLELVAGMFLKNHGKREDALRYLKVTIESTGVSHWSRALASEAVRGLSKN